MCVQNDPDSIVSEQVTTDSSDKGFALNMGDRSLWEATSSESESTIQREVTDYQKFNFKMNSKLLDSNLTLNLRVKKMAGCKITIFKSKNYSDSGDNFKIFEINPSNVNEFSYFLSNQEQQQGYSLLVLVEPTDLSKSATFELNVKVGKISPKQSGQAKSETKPGQSIKENIEVWKGFLQNP